MINHFNSNIAVQYNINAAIFIQQLAQWTFRNLANKHHIYDGLCWSFNTLEGYEQIFPYWNRRQLETIISNLVKEGLVQKGNYNSHKYDRTCWYALSYKAMAFFPELITDDYLKALSSTISHNCDMETQGMSKDELCNYHFTKMRNAVHENVTPIPTSNPTKDISNDISGNSHDSVNEDKETKSKPKKSTFGIDELKADNPHNIPESMLSDWLEVRNTKKNKVTATAWNKINKTLSSIQEKINISPESAFETMVTRAWQSLELEYFKENENGKKTVDNFPAYE